ncbi:MAG: methyl-accepting chemotaxis protein [Maritimibacter sp.]
MTTFAKLASTIREANHVKSDDLDSMRRWASVGYISYLWLMTGVVTLLAAGWSDMWVQVLVICTVLSAGATIAWRRSAHSLRTRLIVGSAMTGNWIMLIYASTDYGAGEFVLDAHMIFFIINGLLLGYFCWRTILIANAITLVHHVSLSFLMPLLIWPSTTYAEIHLLNHILMAALTGTSAMVISIAVSRLFGKADLALMNLRAGIEERERLEAEKESARKTALELEQQEREREATEQAHRDAEAKEKRARESAAQQAEQQRLAEEEAKARQTAEEQTQIVTALAGGLKALSKGDLRVTLDQKFPDAYETLRADFNSAVSSLRDVILRLSESAETVHSSSQEISNAAADLARRTERNAATLGETSSMMTKLTTSVKAAAEGAERSNSAVNNAKSNAKNASEVVDEAVSAMEEISASSGEIKKIISVIDEIAFQTNLLALNAGVEAARAGEAGRGFAVVASEVRDLAQRSSAAAGEISTLISNSGQQVERGVAMVGKTGSVLETILNEVADISDQMSGIATSAREQSTGISEIDRSVADLDQSTQQNAAMFEETSAASASLTSQASILTDIVAQFVLDKGSYGDVAQDRVATETNTRSLSTPKVA